MNLVQRLKEAADSGEILTIVYHGGSQPGSVRKIAPIKVTDREIRARCYSSNAVKNFKISKMEICGQEHLERPYEEKIDLKVHLPKDILEVLQHRVEELKSLGWHVKISEEAISLHRFFKIGKPLKGSDVGIMNNSESPSRPWYVYGPGLASARTYSNLNKAVLLFLEQAMSNAPCKRKT